MSLELGGKNLSIVFPDAADDDLIANLLLSSRVHRQGRCTAGSRLFLHEDIYDDVLQRFVATLDAQVIGNPLDESSDIGAIIMIGNSSPRTPSSRRGCPLRVSRWLGRITAGDRAHRRLLHGSDRLRRSRQRLAAVSRRDFRPRCGRHPVARRGRRHRWPTIRTTVWPPTCGPTTSTARCAQRTRWRPLQVNQAAANWWGSPTAATSRAGSAARLRWRE